MYFSSPSVVVNLEIPEFPNLHLRLIAQGATNREIATQLIISEGTVKNHLSNILSRLGLRARTQAAIYAKEQELL